MYFLIPAILIVIGLINYSTFRKTNSETLTPAETQGGHVNGDDQIISTTTEAHKDSVVAPRAHE